jgi:hypothetical protein
MGGLNYCNRDNFRIVVQAFDDPHGGVAITTRRRDGSTTGYWPEENYHVLQPEHVALHSVVHIDEHLLKALLRAQEAKTWEHFWDSIINFNLANTDSSDITLQVEVVLFNGAFERLLDCNRGKEDELAERFANMLRPTNGLAPSTCARLSDQDIVNRFRHSSTVRNMWIRDFFRLRGALAHGKLASRHRPVWSLRDHLLLASFAFPLLLKASLAEESLYSLSEDDLFQIDLFEPLACEEHLVPVPNPHNSHAHPWDQVIERMSRERLHKRIAAELEKLWQSSTG